MPAKILYPASQTSRSPLANLSSSSPGSISSISLKYILPKIWVTVSSLVYHVAHRAIAWITCLPNTITDANTNIDLRLEGARAWARDWEEAQRTERGPLGVGKCRIQHPNTAYWSQYLAMVYNLLKCYEVTTLPRFFWKISLERRLRIQHVCKNVAGYFRGWSRRSISNEQISFESSRVGCRGAERNQNLLSWRPSYVSFWRRSLAGLLWW